MSRKRSELSFYVTAWLALFVAIVVLSAAVGSGYYMVFAGLSVFMPYADFMRVGIVPVLACAVVFSCFFAPFVGSALFEKYRKEGGRK